MTTHTHKRARRVSRGIFFSLAAIAAASLGATAAAQKKDDKGSKEMKPPIPGLQTYTQAHAKHQNPPQLLGGPIEVEITQDSGVTYFVLPGPRELDPAVFGTPDQPVGFDPAPFPLLGVPIDERLTHDGEYTFASAATPFSDWAESGEGSLNMRVVDRTAIDGATTDDTIDFECSFKAPDGTPYRVVCKRPLPHGSAYPFFGGVVTNHMLHGATGIGTRLMPSEFAYVAFWGVGDVYRQDTKIADEQIIHIMVTEVVRGDGYELVFDDGVGDPPATKTLHLMVPPFAVGEDGIEKAPLFTGFMPFPLIEPRMEAAMKAAKEMPENKRAKRMARLEQVRKMMQQTKKHVMKATSAGKMDGQPFFHVMFNDFDMKAGPLRAGRMGR